MTDEQAALQQEVRALRAENQALKLEAAVRQQHYILVIAAVHEIATMLDTLGKVAEQG